MPAAWPASVRVFTTKLDLTDVVYAAHVNEIQEEVVAIETYLGTNPQSTYSSVSARIAAVEASAGHSHPYLSTTGGTMTGALTLPGNPASALEAAPKQYVDTKLPLTGGTVTGGVTFTGGTAPGAAYSGAHMRFSTPHPSVEFHDTDVVAGGAGKRYWFHHNGGNLYILFDPNDGGAWDSRYPFVHYGASRLVRLNNNFDVSETTVDMRTTDVVGGKFITVFDKVAYNGTALSGTIALDWTVAAVHSTRIGAAATFTFTWPGMVASTDMYTVSLALWSNGAYGLTWPSGTYWVGGAAPTIDAAGIHLFHFTRVYIAGAWRVIGNYGGRAA